MRGGKLLGGGFAHVGNRQRVNPARERRGLGTLERVENLRGVLLAERARLVVRAEIQFAKRFQFQVEQVERFFDETAFQKLFRDNASERFEVERLALREIFDAPRELRRTARDVLATPRDFLVRHKLTFGGFLLLLPAQTGRGLG